MVDVTCRRRKPLLLMYNDNYRYGTGLYVPVVNSLDRPREHTILPEYLPRTPAPLPKVPLAEHDLYAPISYGYGRNLLKPTTPISYKFNYGEQEPRRRNVPIYYKFDYGEEVPRSKYIPHYLRFKYGEEGIRHSD